jgi:branched-chain amino acid transport system ATP-binding protein
MLRLSNLNTHYGASHVLQGVDLHVPAGRICSLLGRNGVGKTTTVRTIMGLTPPTSGQVLLDGQDIAGWAPHKVARAGVAYVPEGRLIFPDLSVLENIRVGERKPAKVWTLDRLLTLFPSLRERSGNRGWQLSGGEQQMLAIARALVSDPRMLLLDEPSQGLAPLVVRELGSVIQRLCAEGVTILLIEQNMKLAEEVADELHVMVKGRIVYGASPEVFRAEADSVRARYLAI